MRGVETARALTAAAYRRAVFALLRALPARAAATAGVALAPETQHWLAAQAQAGTGDVLQTWQDDPATTIVLASATALRGAKVRVAVSADGEAVERWHRGLIAAQVVPHVVLLPSHDAAGAQVSGGVDVAIARTDDGADGDWPELSRHGDLVARRRP